MATDKEDIKNHLFSKSKSIKFLAKLSRYENGKIKPPIFHIWKKVRDVGIPIKIAVNGAAERRIRGNLAFGQFMNGDGSNDRNCKIEFFSTLVKEKREKRVRSVMTVEQEMLASRVGYILDLKIVFSSDDIFLFFKRSACVLAFEVALRMISTTSTIYLKAYLIQTLR